MRQGPCSLQRRRKRPAVGHPDGHGPPAGVRVLGLDPHLAGAEVVVRTRLVAPGGIACAVDTHDRHFAGPAGGGPGQEDIHRAGPAPLEQALDLVGPPRGQRPHVVAVADRVVRPVGVGRQGLESGLGPGGSHLHRQAVPADARHGDDRAVGQRGADLRIPHGDDRWPRSPRRRLRRASPISSHL